MALSREALRRARVERQGEAVVRRLESAVVGIAGLGGLGSHIAVSLARLGVGKLVLADFDRVDVTNLHRQQYFIEQLGRYKTDALAETLRRVDPWLSCELHPVRLTPENLPGIFAGCSVLCEAFDRPEEKAMLIETALTELPHTVVVSGSGMAGTGSANTIQNGSRHEPALSLRGWGNRCGHQRQPDRFPGQRVRGPSSPYGSAASAGGPNTLSLVPRNFSKFGAAVFCGGVKSIRRSYL